MYIGVRIALWTFSCILCKSKKVAPVGDSAAKRFSDALEEIRRNHLPTYDMQKNPEYADILREMRKIARSQATSAGEEGVCMDSPEGERSAKAGKVLPLGVMNSSDRGGLGSNA